MAGGQVSYVFGKKDPQQEGDMHHLADLHQRVLGKLTLFHRVVRHTSQVCVGVHACVRVYAHVLVRVHVPVHVSVLLELMTGAVDDILEGNAAG